MEYHYPGNSALSSNITIYKTTTTTIDNNNKEQRLLNGDDVDDDYPRQHCWFINGQTIYRDMNLALLMLTMGKKINKLFINNSIFLFLFLFCSGFSVFVLTVWNEIKNYITSINA